MLSICGDFCQKRLVASKTEPIIDVDAYAAMVERAAGKLPPEDVAYLRAISQRFLDVREELLKSDASLERIERLLCGMKA
jgi:hypothetical protein